VNNLTLGFVDSRKLNKYKYITGAQSEVMVMIIAQFIIFAKQSCH